MSNQLTIEDPNTGLIYDFRPLFDFTGKYECDLRFLTNYHRRGLRYNPYLLLHQDELEQVPLLSYCDDTNELFDAFHKIAPI